MTLIEKCNNYFNQDQSYMSENIYNLSWFYINDYKMTKKEINILKNYFNL